MSSGPRTDAPPAISPGPQTGIIGDTNSSSAATPGDCIMFDMRTLHGALVETVPDRTIRRYTLRMTAEDGRIRYRGDWAKGERAIFEAAGHKEGDEIDSAFFPRLWTAG